MGLNQREIASLSGLSVRQLDYWCRTGAFCPSNEKDGSRGMGYHRDYSHRDLIAARMLARVRRALGGTVPVVLVGQVVQAVGNDGELAPLTVDLGHDVSLRIGVDIGVRA